MSGEGSGRFVPRSAKYLQRYVQASGPAAMASYSLIGAIILIGGIGFAVDSTAGTSPWGLLTGLLVGLVVGFWELGRIVWRR